LYTPIQIFTLFPLPIQTNVDLRQICTFPQNCLTCLFSSYAVMQTRKVICEKDYCLWCTQKGQLYLWSFKDLIICSSCLLVKTSGISWGFLQVLWRLRGDHCRRDVSNSSSKFYKHFYYWNYYWQYILRWTLQGSSF